MQKQQRLLRPSSLLLLLPCASRTNQTGWSLACSQAAAPAAGTLAAAAAPVAPASEALIAAAWVRDERGARCRQLHAAAKRG